MSYLYEHQDNIMPFLTEENFKLVPGSEKVILQSPLKYQIPDNFPVKELRGVVITADTGFISDLASIPRLFLNVIKKLGKHRMAAVIHDKGYVDPGELAKWIWDLIFLYAMIETGVIMIKSQTMYRAVKYGGYFAWRSHRKQDREA